MRLKAVSGITLTVFLLGMLTLTCNVQRVAAPLAVDWWSMRGHDLNHTGYSTSTAPNTNNVIWSLTTGNSVCASPAVVDGKVFVGSGDYKVYCLDSSTGAHVWDYTTDNEVYSSPAVADGKVYVGSYDGRVYCLDASTGAHIWNHITGSYVFSSPAVADGKVFVGSDDGRVYAFGFVRITGDINGDSWVDIYDAILLANAFNSKPGNSNWNPEADLNSDGTVDIFDGILLANHFNQHYP